MAGVRQGTSGVGLDRLIWRGEVYDVDLGHPIGHEPAFTGPAIVVSADVLNNGAGDLVVIMPVGSAVISTERIVARRGMAAVDEVHAIDQALRFILDL
jgi:mRNA interferase MazF